MRRQEFDRLKGCFSFEERLSGIGDYFQASVLAPPVLADGVYHLVFEQRASHIRQGGEICFPGGRVDPGDASPLDTALRETREEIGCPPGSVEVIGRLDTVLLSSGSIVHAYLGILSRPVDPAAVAKEEVASVFTMPLSFFFDHAPEVYECKVLIHPYLTDPQTGEKQVLLPTEALGLPAYYSEPWGGAAHRIYVYHTEHGLLWGLTARIVYECVERMKGMGEGCDG